MRGGDRSPERGGRQYHCRRGDLTVEGVDGSNLEDPETDRAHDAPAAGKDAQGDGRSAGQHHPEGDVKIRGHSAAEQDQGDDAHALLGIVGAVRKGEAGAGDHLAALEEAVDAGRGGAHEGKDQSMNDKAGPEPDDGGEDQGGDHLGHAGELALGELMEAPYHVVGARRYQDRPGESADERMGGGGRYPEPPGNDIPGDGTAHAA